MQLLWRLCCLVAIGGSGSCWEIVVRVLLDEGGRGGWRKECLRVF